MHIKIKYLLINVCINLNETDRQTKVFSSMVSSVKKFHNKNNILEKNLTLENIPIKIQTISIKTHVLYKLGIKKCSDINHIFLSHIKDF